MSKKDVKRQTVRLHRGTPTEATQIVLEENSLRDVFVVVTQLYCPLGHNLVGLSNQEFDGFPGISLWVSHGDQAGEVIISPIHGDGSKRGASFPKGAKLSLACPTCKTEIPELTTCKCQPDARLRKLFLTPTLSEAHLVAVCDIWGCPLSRVIDSYEMFSEYLEGHIGEP
jgi:hypothetical protein